MRDAIILRAERLAATRNRLNETGIDALLLTSRENSRYLSGFSGSESYLVITREQAVIFVDFRYLEQAADESPDFEIVDCTKDRSGVLLDFLRDQHCRRLGVEEEQLSWKMSGQLLERHEVTELVPCENWLLALRSVKDELETAMICRATQIAEQAFEELLPTIRPGQKEYEIAARLEQAMRRLGASGPSFSTIVASGPRSAMPHGVAGERTVLRGDPLVIDFGCIWQGYCSDTTRTVFLGEPDGLARKIYGIVLDAQQTAQQAVRAGIPGCDVDRIARDIITAAGYGDCFGHGLGHGIGLAIHEQPRLTRIVRDPLTEGQIVTVEPGIYLPGQFGVRIEDAVRVETGGSTNVNRLGKELVIL